MFRRITFAAACAAVLVLAVAPCPAQETAAAPKAEAPSLTADQVIAKYLDAIGGKDKLKAVKTMRMKGKMTLMPGVEAPFTMEVKRPAAMRMEFTVQGMTGVQAFDGKQGWMVMPFMGKTDPEPMPSEALKDVQENADFEGPLVDYKEKGHQVEMMGKESLQGTDAWKLKVTMKGGDVVYHFLEAESFLPIGQQAKRTVQGTEIEVEVTVGDYREVAGLKFPFAMETKMKGMPAGQAMTFESIEVNPEIADDRFAMPAKKAEEPKPAEGAPAAGGGR